MGFGTRLYKLDYNVSLEFPKLKRGPDKPPLKNSFSYKSV